jgi:hypothetical protein
MEFDMGDLGDIFGDFFGGGSRKQSRRGRDISTEIDLSFEESIFGVTRDILLSKQSVCDICKGSGGKPGSKMDTCKTCNGKGQIHEMKRSILGSFETRRTCDHCHGSGKIPTEKCTQCSGKGVYYKQQEINVKIPAGINAGEMVRMTGLGEAVQGGQAGDLYIKINIKSHPVFKRDGTTSISGTPLRDSGFSTHIGFSDFFEMTPEDKEKVIKIFKPHLPKMGYFEYDDDDKTKVIDGSVSIPLNFTLADVKKLDFDNGTYIFSKTVLGMTFEAVVKRRQVVRNTYQGIYDQLF